MIRKGLGGSGITLLVRPLRYLVAGFGSARVE